MLDVSSETSIPTKNSTALSSCTAACASLVALIKGHVLAAECLHGDDTTVPVLVKGKAVL